jgi:hypothetical protein
MLYREIIAVCFEAHIKRINTVCALNVEFMNVKPGDTYSVHWASNGQAFSCTKARIWLVCKDQHPPAV